MADYEVKGITTTIRATSRVAIKRGDNFFTVEHMEERSIPDVEGIDMDAERKDLWNAVNGVTDGQVEEIYRITQNQ